MKRVVLIFAGALITFYVAIAAILAVGQTAFIYPAPRAQGHVTGGFEQVIYRTGDGLELAAGYRRAEPGWPTILYFHGNGADWTSSIMATDIMVPEGFGVLAAEYRGYYGNPGTPNEAGLIADGRAAMAFLADAGVAANDVFIVGNSIGSGVAAQIAAEFDPAALILISPFASLSQLVPEKLWWLPTGLLLRDRYDNETALRHVSSPVLILHGGADSLIPPAHAEQLATGRPGTQLEIFPGVDHDLAWHQSAERRALAFMNQIAMAGDRDDAAAQN